MNKKNAVKILILFIIAIIVIFIFTIYFKMPVKTSKIQYGTYEDKVMFNGIFIMQEYPAYHGNITASKLKIKQGDRISKGYLIADNITSPEAGIVIMGYDGYENKYNLKNIKKISSKDIENILNNTKTEQGIKVVNNSEWYICAAVSSKLSEQLKKGASKDILIKDKYYTIEITDSFKNSSGSFVVMKMNEDPDITDLHRGVTGYIIKSRYKGLILPADSVTSFDSNECVYIEYNGYAEVRLVKILFKDEQSAVAIPLPNAINKLSEFDTVIRKPAHIKSGTKVR